MRLFIEKLEKLNVGGVKFKYFIPASACTRAQRVMDGLMTKNGEFTTVFYTSYADDIVLWAESVEELQKMGDLLNELFVKFGLTISIKKTKSMILNYENKPENYPKSIVTIKNENIENIKVFKNF